MILTAETEPEARLKHQLDDLERMLHQLTVLDRADGPEELNRAIDELLCCMGDYTHADRAYLFAFLEKNGTYRNTNEWCAEGVMPQIDNLQAVPYTEMPAWHASFLSGQLIIIPDVSAVRAIMPEALSECCKK